MSFPVINNGYSSYEELLAVEGLYIPNGAQLNGFIWTGQSVGGGQEVGEARATWGVDNGYYYKSIIVGCNKPVLMQILSSYPTNIGQFNSMFFVDGVATIPMDILRKIDNNGVRFLILDVPDANPRSINATANQNGVVVTKSQTTVVNSNLKTYSVVVTVSNFSGASTSGSLVISDFMPSGCKLVSASGTGWTYAASGETYTMTTSDVIPNNGTKTYTLTVQGTLVLNFGVSGHGYAISNDTDYSERPMVWAGTSITNGVGITAYRNNYTYLLKNWLRDNLNVFTRVSNKAISGSTTVTMDDYRNFNNFYDYKQTPKFLFIEHGVNDVSTSVPTATSMANMAAMIKYYRTKYPTCYIIVLSPFPCQPFETGLATYRAALASLMAGYSPSEQVYIKYIAATGTAWNPATEGGTYTTDGIHVNAAGRLLIFNAITNYITTNSLTFP